MVLFDRHRHLSQIKIDFHCSRFERLAYRLSWRRAHLGSLALAIPTPPLSGCLINVMNLGKKRSDLFSCSCNFLRWDERYSQGSLPSSSVIFILTQIEPRLHLVSLLCKPLLRLIISHSDDDTRTDVLETHGCSPLKLSFSLYTSFLCELLAAVLGFRRQLHLLSLADNEIYLFFFIQHLLVLSK